MLDRKFYENALINNEKVTRSSSYNYKTLYHDKKYTDSEISEILIKNRQEGLKLFKENSKDIYEVWLLDGYIMGSDKDERKEWLLSKIRMEEIFLNFNESDLSKGTLESLIELYNKYFNLESESFTANFENKNIYCNWIKNIVMKLHTKEEGYSQYKTFLEIEDYYNHKINGSYTAAKYSIQYPQMFLIFTPTENELINI